MLWYEIDILQRKWPFWKGRVVDACWKWRHQQTKCFSREILVVPLHFTLARIFIIEIKAYRSIYTFNIQSYFDTICSFSPISWLVKVMILVSNIRYIIIYIDIYFSCTNSNVFHHGTFIKTHSDCRRLLVLMYVVHFHGNVVLFCNVSSFLDFILLCAIGMLCTITFNICL